MEPIDFGTQELTTLTEPALKEAVDAVDKWIGECIQYEDWCLLCSQHPFAGGHDKRCPYPKLREAIQDLHLLNIEDTNAST